MPLLLYRIQLDLLTVRVVYAAVKRISVLST